MLVTLANNQTIAANSSSTFTYSPNSFQKLFLHIEDADWDDVKVTVQIGATTICNGITMYGLRGYSAIQSGENSDVAGTDGYVTLDFGSHQCTGNDNLYVTLTAVGEATATDVSAIVDTPGANFPVRLTEYSDSTFTSNNNLLGLCWDAGKAAIDDDTTNVEIRTSINSSAPSVTSASSYYKSKLLAADFGDYWGVLNVHDVPLKTTYNYTPNVMDRILTVEQMGTSRQQIAQARQSARVAVSQAGK